MLFDPFGAVTTADGLSRGDPVAVLVGIIQGTIHVRGVTSVIGKNPAMTALAEEAGKSVQRSLDSLVEQLAKGNLSPGIGTKHLFGDILYARSRDGARVFFRIKGDGYIEILGKASKQNEAQVIKLLEKTR